MNKDKVYLKGYVIGRAADTLGYHGLMVQLENLDIVEIDKNLVHKITDEPQKPVVVPQLVADWYEDIVDEFYVVLERLVLNYKNNTDMPICKWFFETEDALTILINMHQFGYDIEKEKRYFVKLKAVDQYLVRNEDENFLGFLQSRSKSKFTRKELEEAGLSDVFNSPLFEVKEVE